MKKKFILLLGFLTGVMASCATLTINYTGKNKNLNVQFSLLVKKQSSRGFEQFRFKPIQLSSVKVNWSSLKLIQSDVSSLNKFLKSNKNGFLKVTIIDGVATRVLGLATTYNPNKPGLTYNPTKNYVLDIHRNENTGFIDYNYDED